MAENPFAKFANDPLPGMSAERPAAPVPVDVTTRQQGEPPDLSELGLSLPQGGTGGWRDTVDTSITPRPGVATFAPLSRETPDSPAKFAIPNAVRALFTEGPQLDPQGKLTVPGATVDPSSGSLGITPEAAAAGSLLMPGALRFGGANALMRDPVSAFTLTRPPNVTMDELRAAIDRAQPPANRAMPGAADGPPAPTAPAGTGEPSSAGGGPQAAGAQITPAAELGLTRAQEEAYRATAEGQRLLETQQPGVADTNQYVARVQPNTAEIEQTAQAARELKTLNNANPEVKQELAVVADANNAARKAHFDQAAGSKVQLRTAKDERAAQAESDLKATWDNKQDVSPQPMIDEANAIKQSPDGRRPLVRQVVDSVTNELTDANGNLIRDPELLYGVRKHLDDLIEEKGEGGRPKNERAMASLLQLKETLDGVISAGAPGFRAYLDNFKAASKPIDEMTALQSYEQGLYNTQSRMEYSRVQRMMRDIVDARGSPGLNPEKNISEETMQKLWALRNDLRRSTGAVELARATGSDSAQNLMDLMKRGAARGVGGAVGGTVGGVIGGAAGAAGGASLGQRAVDALLSGRAARRDLQRGMEMIYPKNQLGPPLL